MAEKFTRAREVRRLLNNYRKEAGEYLDMQHLLSRYATERFLYRLGQSRYEGQFVLTGLARLAYTFPDILAVPKTIGFHVNGKMPLERMKGIVRDIGAAKLDDGVTFTLRSLLARAVGEGAEHSGFECTLPAKVDMATASVLLSVRFGRAITPEPKSISCQSLLFLPRPKLRAYSLELMAAELLVEIVEAGETVSDLSDHVALWVISKAGSKFGIEHFRLAFDAIAHRKRITIGNDMPHCISPAFAGSETANEAWNQIAERSGLFQKVSLADCCAVSRELFKQATD